MRERIEKILQEKKMTQAEFADLIGVNRSSITHIMTGRNKSSDTVVARTLLVFPDINPNWLSAGEGEMYLEHVYIPPKSNLLNFEESEDKNLLTHFDSYNTDNEDKMSNSEQKNSLSELNIQHQVAHEPIISKSIDDIPVVQKTQELPVSSEGKKIRKIVFFYTDKTFEEYYPE